MHAVGGLGHSRQIGQDHGAVVLQVEVATGPLSGVAAAAAAERRRPPFLQRGEDERQLLHQPVHAAQQGVVGRDLPPLRPLEELQQHGRPDVQRADGGAERVELSVQRGGPPRGGRRRRRVRGGGGVALLALLGRLAADVGLAPSLRPAGSGPGLGPVARRGGRRRPEHALHGDALRLVRLELEVGVDEDGAAAGRGGAGERLVHRQRQRLVPRHLSRGVAGVCGRGRRPAPPAARSPLHQREQRQALLLAVLPAAVPRHFRLAHAQVLVAGQQHRALALALRHGVPGALLLPPHPVPSHDAALREHFPVELDLLPDGGPLGVAVAVAVAGTFHLLGVDDAHGPAVAAPAALRGGGGGVPEQQSHDGRRGGQLRPAGDDARVVVGNADDGEGMELDGAGARAGLLLLLRGGGRADGGGRCCWRCADVMASSVSVHGDGVESLPMAKKTDLFRIENRDPLRLYPGFGRLS